MSPDTDGFRAKTIAEVKSALAGLSFTVPLGVDAKSILPAIAALQAKIRSMGLADFLDVNIPVGKLITQIQLLKRLLSQAGLSDLLGINLDKTSLAKAVAKLKDLPETMVTVEADLDKASLARVEAELRGLSETIPVNFDVSKLPVAGPLQGLSEKIPVSWDIPLLKPLADAAAAGVHESIPVTFDISRLPVMGPVGSLSEKVSIDTSEAQASLAALTKAANDVRAGMGYLDTDLTQAGLDAIAMSRSVDGANNALAIMSGDAARAAASIALGRAAVAGLASDGQGAVTAMQNMAAATAIMDGSAMNFAVAADAASGRKGGGGLAAWLTGLAALNTNLIANGGALGGWGAHLAYTIPILGLVIHSVALFHIAADGIAEALISVSLAALAVTPALLVMANVGQDLVTHFQAVHTVTESLGQSIPPLTGGFDALARAMAPATIEAFGGAMNLVTSKTGLFAEAVNKVVPLLDSWIAKIDLWGIAQGATGKIITSGIGYLTQFADIIGNVVSAFGSLLTKDPGIAHFLLDFINLIALLLKGFTDLPAPVVYATLALHGIYVWAGLMATVLPAVIAYIIKLAASFALVALNPLTWVAAAAASLALLAYESNQATPAVKNLIASLQAGLAADTASQAITAITADIGALNAQLQKTTVANYAPQLSAQLESFGNHIQATGLALHGIADNFAAFAATVPESLSSWSALGKSAESLGHAITSIFDPGNAAASVAVANDVKAIGDAINSMLGQQKNLFAETGHLITQGYSYTQALALMDLAQVKAGDSLAVMQQKVSNLITGYQDMSVQGGFLLNSVNAISLASLQQQSGIQNLTSAWTAFINLVTGGAAAFSTFETQIYGIATAASGAASSLSVSSGKASLSLSGTGLAAASTTTSITGLSQASLQMQSAFTTGVTNANSLINALTLQASASGLASKGTDMLTAATKDTVAQLIPFAGNSVAAQSALVALAQQGGAPAGISFNQLAGWVKTASGSMASMGSSGGPAAQLQGIVGTLAKDSSNLTTDVQNLSIALGTTLSGAMATAIVAASGGQQMFTSLAKAVLTTGVNSGTTQQAAIALGGALLTITGNTSEAQKQFEAFAISGLHLTQQQADSLWNDVLSSGIPALQGLGGKAQTAQSQFVNFANSGLGITKANAQQLWQMFTQQNIDLMSTKAGGAKAQFIALAQQGLDLTKTSAQQLWTTFVNQKLTEVGTQSDETKTQFETLATQLGLTKTAADKLWTSLHTIAAGSPYNAGVHVTASGSGGMTYTEKVAASISSGGFSLLSAAGGMLITSGTGPTADDVPILVSRGETVVSAADSKKLAPAFRAVGVPGYAGGGNPTGMVPFVQNAEVNFTQSVEAALLKAEFAHLKATVAAQAKTAAAAISAGGVGLPGVAGSGGAAPGSGTLSIAQLEALWIQAGGPASAAYNMARIAIAESGGQVDIVNSIGASGLWQIYPAQAGSLNALTNAQQAVAKYEASGYYPWISDPVAAGLIASGVTRAQGGLVKGYAGGGWLKGYAAGGLVGSVPINLSKKLTADQAAEKSAYSSADSAVSSALGKAAKGSWLATNAAAVKKELGYLVRDQSYETSSYGSMSDLAAKTLTSFRSQIAWLTEDARNADLRTPAPSQVSALAGKLSTLNTAAGTPVPVPAGTSMATGTAAQTASNATTGATGWKYYQAWKHGTEINKQIGAAKTALGKNTKLAGSALTAALKTKYASAVTSDNKQIAALNTELTTMRDWRLNMQDNDTSLAGWISSAGSTKDLSGYVAAWKKQEAAQVTDINNISTMLGPGSWDVPATAAQIAAAGTVASQGTSATGAADLKAFLAKKQSPVNAQIAWQTAQLKKDTTLAGASGLTKAQHAQYVAAEAHDKAMIASLNSTLTTMRNWRIQLQDSDATLASWVSAAGGTTNLATDVATWKAHEAAQEATISQINTMLGPGAWDVAAAPAAASTASAGSTGSTDTSGASTSTSGSTTTTTPVTVTAVADPLTTAMPMIASAFTSFLNDLNAFAADITTVAPGAAGATYPAGVTAAAGSLTKISGVYGGTGGVLTGDLDTILGDITSASAPITTTMSDGTTVQTTNPLVAEVPQIAGEFGSFLAEINAALAGSPGGITGGTGTITAAMAKLLASLRAGSQPVIIPPAVTGAAAGGIVGGYAAGGIPVRSYDSGGTLPPGMTMAWNGTGRNEQVTAASTPATVQLEISGSGSGTFDAFLLTWLKNNVRVRGGGSVQRAWGKPGIKS